MQSQQATLVSNHLSIFCNLLKILLSINLVCNILSSQTKSQIDQAKKAFMKSGMTSTEAKALAKSKGYSDQQIEKVINDQRDSKNSAVGTSGIEPLETKKDLSLDENLDFEDVELNSDDVDNEEKNDLTKEGPINPKPGLKFFGYSIFQGDPLLFQPTSVGAVDPSYLVGPGDEIIIMLWGETQFREVLKVNREGFLFIPEIGQVFVNGLTLKFLESKLFRVFSKSYASLNPQNRNPTTFLDISIGKLRPLKIQVLGEVAQPGAYTVSPSTTLFSALYYFNGPTKSGSLREIQLIRNGEVVGEIDFYDYLLTGKKPNDQKLQLGDVIFVPRRLKTVSIRGAINRSGIYELKPDEDFYDLINIAGNLKVTAYLNRASIDRIVPFADRLEKGMDRIVLDANLKNIFEKKDKFSLQDGDYITIYSIFDQRQNVVYVDGAIERPGLYDIGDSLRLSELINKADGVLGNAYLDRINIVRLRDDFSKELIQLNLAKVLEKNDSDDIFLKSGDEVNVLNESKMKDDKFVYISGHVKLPGSYALFENMTVLDLLFMGGGLWDEDFKSLAKLDRADLIRLEEDRINKKIISFNLESVLNDHNSPENQLLKPGDHLKIFSEKIYTSIPPVFIEGSINLAGQYEYKSEMNLLDLIFEAGGILENVYRFKVEIARIDPGNNSKMEYANSDVFEFYTSDLADNSKNQKLKDKLLEPYDIITIRKDPYFILQKKVEILGQVLYPGEYVILHPNEKVTDIIDRAGGTTEKAYLKASQFIRNGVSINMSFEKIVKNPRSDLNFSVIEGDEILINNHPNMVYISGEVNSSGVFKFIPKKRVRYFLNISGGLTNNADKSNIWIEYPDGVSKQFKKWSLFSPKVLDGSRIVVGTKAESEPFDSTEFAKEFTSIIANLAQALAVFIIAKP